MTRVHCKQRDRNRGRKGVSFSERRNIKGRACGPEGSGDVLRGKRKDARKSIDSSFFLTGNICDDFEDEKPEYPPLPVFKTEFQDLMQNKRMKRGSLSSNRKAFKHNTNPRRFKSKHIPPHRHKKPLTLKKPDEIESLNDIKINFEGTQGIFDNKGDSRLDSYIQLKRKFKKLVGEEDSDPKFINSLHLPLPKDNQYWKSDLDHKLRCLLRVDQEDYESDEF